MGTAKHLVHSFLGVAVLAKMPQTTRNSNADLKANSIFEEVSRGIKADKPYLRVEFIDKYSGKIVIQCVSNHKISQRKLLVSGMPW